MSQEVDERVVEMRFDNAQFEKNVRQTMQSLEKLHDSLQLDGAEKGFEKISDASAKVDFDEMQGALETLNSRFSAVEVMGVSALMHITNQAMLELTVEMGGTDVTGSCVVMAEDNASAQIRTRKEQRMNFNITAGTIARTAVLLLALTNQMLSAMGKSPLPIESTTVEQLVTAGITTIAALVAWWKNNSFTKEAIAADKEYDRLKAKSGK